VRSLPAVAVGWRTGRRSACGPRSAQAGRRSSAESSRPARYRPFGAGFGCSSRGFLGSRPVTAPCLTGEEPGVNLDRLSRHYPCPGCGTPVLFEAVRCAHCDVPLLFGLVAPPVTDPRSLESAAQALASAPGGPSAAEARRRLIGGLPLVVGISRQRAEQLQGALLDLGVVPRLGPAPRGTRPLGVEPKGSGIGSRVLLGVLVPLLAAAVFWAVDRSRSSEREAETAREGTPPAAGAPAHRLVAMATIERTRVGWMILEGRVQVVSADFQPAGEVELSLRRDAALLWTRTLTPPEQRESGAVPALRFRESLHDVPLEGGEELALEVLWDGWRADPVELTAPRAPTASR